MKRTTKRLILIVAGIPFLSLAYSNCSGINNKAQFTEAANHSSSTPIDPGTTEEVLPNRYEFTKTVVPSEVDGVPLDLVWVIDNSGSMSQEAAHVRTNFDSFISQVASRTDLKVALISKPDGPYGVKMANQSATRMQVESEVDSFNSLVMASAAMCDSSVLNCANFGLSKPAPVTGSLVSFLRPSSKKVFVVVSDDQSRITPDQFLTNFSLSFPGQSPALFGFVGLGASASPCQYKTGSHYSSLADSTGGKVYNICEADWSAHFNDLVKKVVDISIPAIPFVHVNRNIVVLQILLDGMPLKASEYSIDSKGIRLDKSIFSAAGQSRVLKFVYELK